MSKIHIKQITAHGSELGDLINGRTFHTVAGADAEIFGLIRRIDRGFAKTKLTVEFEDGQKEYFDCDYNEGEGLADAIAYIVRKYSADAEWDRFFQSKEEYEERKQVVLGFNEKYSWE